LSDCPFCAIAGREAANSGEAAEAAHVVYEDEDTIAFLDKRPLFHGHTLLIPREHYVTLADLPAELVGPLFANAQLLSVAVVEAMGAVGSFVALNNVVSQSVPHLHVHVVPRRPKDGLRGFFWPRTKYEDEAEMRGVAAKVREVAEGLAAQRQ
jgi:histidine triad (HIT) family protein